MSKRIGKGTWQKRAAMEQQLGAALRAMVDSPADDITMMQWHPPKEPIDRIIKLLLSLSDYGYQPYQVFRDWVTYGRGRMRTIPLDLCHIARTGSIIVRLEDLPEDLREQERLLRSTYAHHLEKAISRFQAALDILLEAADLVVYDWAGAVWERLELGGRGGQFFTPWQLAMAMAEVQHLAEDVVKNLIAALNHPQNLYGSIALLMWRVAEGLPEQAQQAYFLKHVVPAALPFIEPIRLCDPACGSGRLLLAAAAHVPHWANLGGIVTYSGMDNDSLCVAMAQFMADVYGLNTIGAETIVALDQARQARGGTAPDTQQNGFSVGGSGAHNGARHWERTEAGWEVVAGEGAAARPVTACDACGCKQQPA